MSGFAPGSNTQLCEESAQPTNLGRNVVFGFPGLCHLLKTHLTWIFGTLTAGADTGNGKSLQGKIPPAQGAGRLLGRRIPEPTAQPGEHPQACSHPWESPSAARSGEQESREATAARGATTPAASWSLWGAWAPARTLGCVRAH